MNNISNLTKTVIGAAVLALATAGCADMTADPARHRDRGRHRRRPRRASSAAPPATAAAAARPRARSSAALPAR